MQLQQVSVKVFAAGEPAIDLAELIPVFHRWIQERRLGDELLIDVADYRHVHHGPGVVLIGHQAHYGLDRGGGQLGLLYARRRDPAGDPRQRIDEALRAALTACRLLEDEPALGGRLRFSPGELEIKVLSRLVAPNTPETAAALSPIIAEALTALFGAAPVIEHQDDARAPFGVRARVTGAPSW